ncbi:hypothetical protein YA0783_24885 [Pseudomonas corrugata]|uniref:hypothetical protein n=1 Tax=Pseudomonas corrugata TaxID=47879 RepID=UPI0018E630D6|nr:hypothetical protein [Pseudomonas corrugata]MBI6621528.1 hypothetical protein [Pseudomonas corrugata]MBI6694237.1 hypothetical protein [Pseudomonas corrugata]
MKALTIVKVAVTVVVASVLAGCLGSASTGDQFVGVWKNNAKLKKTLTVSKVDDTFVLVEDLDGPNGPFGTLEAHGVAKSEHVLAKADSGKTFLMLTNDGKKLTSYMRATTDDTYTKVAECVSADCKLVKAIN